MLKGKCRKVGHPNAKMTSKFMVKPVKPWLESNVMGARETLREASLDESILCNGVKSERTENLELNLPLSGKRLWLKNIEWPFGHIGFDFYSPTLNSIDVTPTDKCRWKRRFFRSNCNEKPVII